MDTQIPMFATANDTVNFAVAVDGKFGFFSSREQALLAYDSICSPDQHFDDSCFGACQLLPPGYRPINGLAKPGESREMTRALLSEHRAIDIADYIAKRPERLRRRPLPQQTLAQRLGWRHWNKEMFGGLK